jgi:glycerophosphoryl diester phosphodiesterase
MLRIGHRGTTQHGLENTVTAFRKAMREGGDGVELDVRESKDGVLVVSHDPRVDRVTDGSGFVKDLTLSELKDLAVAGVVGQFATYSEALDAVSGSNKLKMIQIDLKVPGVSHGLAAQINGRRLRDIAVVSSFRKDLLREMKGTDSGIMTGLIKIMPFSGPIEYLASETEKSRLKLKIKDKLYHIYLYPILLINRLLGSAGSDLLKDANEIGTDYIMFYWRAGTKRFVRRAHEEGFSVVAGMVDTERGMRRMERIGVDVAVTNRYDLLRHK